MQHTCLHVVTRVFTTDLLVLCYCHVFKFLYNSSHTVRLRFKINIKFSSFSISHPFNEILRFSDYKITVSSDKDASKSSWDHVLSKICTTLVLQERRKVMLQSEWLLDGTCGAVTLAVRLPACTSISHAYSKVSLPRGRPSAENMAWARSCRPDRLMWPSRRTSSTAGRC